MPMEIIGPVVGLGAVIGFVAAAVIVVRFAFSRLPVRKAAGQDQGERDRLLEDVQARVAELDDLSQRVSELEERVEFAERLLTKQRDGSRLEHG